MADKPAPAAAAPALLDGGSYEVIRERLRAQAAELAAKAHALQEANTGGKAGTLTGKIVVVPGA